MNQCSMAREEDRASEEKRERLQDFGNKCQRPGGEKSDGASRDGIFICVTERASVAMGYPNWTLSEQSRSKKGKSSAGARKAHLP